MARSIIQSTSPSIEGRRITLLRHRIGEAIMGANVGQGSMLMVTVSGTAVVVE